MKDYNAIEWNSILMYDTSSETGLVWKINIMGGNHKKRYLAKEGSVAGTIHESKDGRKVAVVTYNGKKYISHRIIWILHNGFIDNSLVIDHIDRNSLNNAIENLRQVDIAVNSRNSKMTRRNTSGVVGVRFMITTGCTYVIARWYENGKMLSKNFSVKKLGLLPAFASACKYREDQINRLNTIGYGYTENHGRVLESNNFK